MSLPNIPFYKQNDLVASCSAHSNRKILSGSGYLRLKLLDMRLGRDWVFTKTYVPSFHVLVSGKSDFELLVDPFMPGGSGTSSIDARTVDISSHYVTPYIPYYGNRFDAYLGLFAVPDKDLAHDMLRFLTDVSSALLLSNITTSLMFTDLVKRGVGALLGLNGTKQKIAWRGQIGGTAELAQTVYVVAPPELTKRAKDLTLGKDLKLRLNGNRIANIDYFVFAVTVSNDHDEWKVYPDIKPYYDAWRIAAFQRRDNESDRLTYNLFLENLVNALYKSSLLVETHVNAIIDQLSHTLSDVEDMSGKLYRGEEDQRPTTNEREFADGFDDLVFVRDD